MNYQVFSTAAVVLALTSAVACERTNDDATTGRTHTTSAETTDASRQSIGQDLEQAGKSLGSAAEKAADKTAEEAKVAAKKLDEIKIDVRVDKEAGAAPSRR